MSVLGEAAEEAIREALAGLERDVRLTLEVGPAAEQVTVLAGGRELDFESEARRVIGAVAHLSDRISLDVVEREVPGRYPALTIGDELRYVGVPWGYELAALVGGIGEAGREGRRLSAASLEALATLERSVSLEVYVTPT